MSSGLRDEIATALYRVFEKRKPQPGIQPTGQWHFAADRILAIPAIQHGQVLRELERKRHRDPSISTHSEDR